MMEQIGKRIADFWKGLLTKDQQHDLLQELKEEEGSLKKKLEQEFPQVDRTDNNLLSDSEYQSILKELHKKMGVNEIRKVPLRLPSVWMVAAAVALFLGIGTAFIVLEQRFSSIDSKQHFAQVGQDTTRLFNEKEEEQQRILADGSIVFLSPGSEVLFTADYGKKDRVLRLTGQARFQVAHDTTRPFVVWANNYTTTALGTEFIIDTRKSKTLDIMLLSGKIVVKATTFSAMPIVDQYLLPGDQLTINAESQSFALSKSQEMNHAPTRIKNKKYMKMQENIPLLFEDSPLEEVFSYIASRKNVTIVTDSVDLDGLSFTGEFKDSESLLSIVHIVCQMNNLQYVAENNRILIQKKPQAELIIAPEEKETQTTD
ncbi:FecR family protein [Sphingobacterium sp. LRF_L2]|uniref:FecR family protein n=1 Tax=Sphingobacterium sp. LRF_L2 TaxID=3369421 RepID=UPI003F5FEE8E